MSIPTPTPEEFARIARLLMADHADPDVRFLCHEVRRLRRLCDRFLDESSEVRRENDRLRTENAELARRLAVAEGLERVRWERARKTFGARAGTGEGGDEG